MPKHYLPSAQPAEVELLKELAGQLPIILITQEEFQQDKLRYRVYFESTDISLCSYIWYELAKLRKNQERLEHIKEVAIDNIPQEEHLTDPVYDTTFAYAEDPLDYCPF